MHRILCLFAILTGISMTNVAADPISDSAYLAQSSWPMAHRTQGQTASTPIPAPLGSRNIVTLHLLEDSVGEHVGTSPWHVISGNSYPGEPEKRTVWGASLKYAYKFAMTQDDLRFAGSFKLTRLGSISWNLIALSSQIGSRILVPQPRGLRQGNGPCRGDEPALIELRDGPTATSAIKCTRKFELSDDVVRAECPVPRTGWRQGYSATRTGVTYSGEIVTNATYVRRGSFGARKRSYTVLIDNDLTRIVACAEIGEGTSTNNVPVMPTAQGGSALFIATETELVRMNWQPVTGNLTVGWRLALPFRGRTGTTPTLVDAGGRRSVVVIDAMCAVTNPFTGNIDCADEATGPSRLIAVDTETATIQRLDLPPGIRTVENSPAAADGLVVVANYGGYRANPDAKGVVAARWSAAAAKWEIAWTNSGVQMNGVPTISTGSNAVYSSGLAASGQIQMTGLGLTGPTAGKVVMRASIGDPEDWLDAGVNTVVARDGTLIYGADAGIVHLRQLK
ncbi:MAG: hypothetical protein AAF666_01790 [Pseudomonadota bacterium]